MNIFENLKSKFYQWKYKEVNLLYDVLKDSTVLGKDINKYDFNEFLHSAIGFQTFKYIAKNFAIGNYSKIKIYNDRIVDYHVASFRYEVAALKIFVMKNQQYMSVIHDIYEEKERNLIVRIFKIF